MKPLRTVLAIVVAQLVVTHPSSACTCVETTTLEAFREVDFVAVGTARERPADSDGHTVRFTIEKVLKGSSVTSVDLHDGGGSCRTHFMSGERYLIFATRTNERLFTNLCFPNRTLNAALNDLDSLDPEGRWRERATREESLEIVPFIDTSSAPDSDRDHDADTDAASSPPATEPDSRWPWAPALIAGILLAAALGATLLWRRARR